ncbi:MAG: phenylalanine--tRNA ligase subunit alpha [Acholeplasmataceae bacterium]|jgi:phenylalanyl-tRNA synthetase alpha chain|nr:phenylalanine--tRNA ligase subunit alpha [Acholeplasmataceae bacterium]
MTDQLLKTKNQFQEALAATRNLNDLNETKALYLGKKSPLQEILAKMKDLSVEEKKTLGKSVNDFKNYVESEISKRYDELAALEVERRLEEETIDITLPGKKFPIGHQHPFTKVIEEIEEIFIGMGYQIAEGPEVETDHYNFELLNLPKGHPAREMQDSFYIDPTYLLRTHTSPVQARTMQASQGKPIKIICPGKVYRRDDDDATHSHQFMQIEGLVVDENITMTDLKGTLSLLMKKMFGDHLEVRFRPSYFPFTEPSVEVDVTCFKCGGKGCSLCKNNGWIELLGAGMVHPNVLEMSGYDSRKYQGFAFGLGIERLAMFRYGIEDIRYFYLNDPRFLKQF